MLSWLAVYNQAVAAVVLEERVTHMQLHDYHGGASLRYMPPECQPVVLYVGHNAHYNLCSPIPTPARRNFVYRCVCVCVFVWVCVCACVFVWGVPRPSLQANRLGLLEGVCRGSEGGRFGFHCGFGAKPRASRRLRLCAVSGCRQHARQVPCARHRAPALTAACSPLPPPPAPPAASVLRLNAQECAPYTEHKGYFDFLRGGAHATKIGARGAPHRNRALRPLSVPAAPRGRAVRLGGWPVLPSPCPPSLPPYPNPPSRDAPADAPARPGRRRGVAALR